MICGSLPKTLNTCGPLLINKNTYLCFGFCSITEELFNIGLCSWPSENLSWTPRVAEGPGCETLYQHIITELANAPTINPVLDQLYPLE